MKRALLFSFLALALNVPARAQDAKKGETLFAQKCVLCHGKDGSGIKAQEAPRIAGQHDWYIVSQLQNFKSKKRSNPKMFPYISGLSDTDMKDLAAYVSKL